ncbi:hypothetical protein P8452_45931 [Trifolium repens]|nr:hypothetical protein P8452_45931 [Trifolium repens]
MTSSPAALTRISFKAIRNRTTLVTDNPRSAVACRDIQAAMHTFSISPPDEQWYMDSGATSHMTGNGGFSDRNSFNEM